jgi:LysM domain
MALRQQELERAPATVPHLRLAAESEQARRGPSWARTRMVARRRRLVVAVVASCALTAALVLGGGARGSAPASLPGAPRVVIVRPGETLWDVAERYADPAVDRRAYVDALTRRNDLHGVLQPSARIRLPR